MQYTNLGSTGMTVSRICLGCMSYGNPKWRPWVLDEAAAQPFFRHALDNGINFFDTADMYSLGVSEEITGRALRSMARLDEVVIATKVNYPMSDASEHEGPVAQAHHSGVRGEPQAARDRHDRSLSDPSLRSGHADRGDARRARSSRRSQGKVRYIGASSGFAWQLMKALSVSDLHGWTRFVSMQPQYNLLYREEEREMIPLCRAEGLAIIPWSPLGRGWLARPRDKTKGDDRPLRQRPVRRSALLTVELGDRRRGRTRRDGARRLDGADRAWRGYSRSAMSPHRSSARRSSSSRGRDRRARSSR